MNEGRHAPLSKVVIVGGGSAGWMTAAALSRMVAAGVSVTLVESEEIGIVGVGEATIPSLLDFNRALHIDEHQFVAETMGTFKLGIEFVDWGGLGQRYIHPFGKIGRGALGVPFHQIWLRQYLLGDPQRDPGDLGDYALCTVAARSGRFAKPAGGPDSVLASLGYAYHFDASRYAAEVTIPDLKQSIRETENQLNLLLGRVPGPVTRSSIDVQQPVMLLKTGVPAQLLANRPDVAAAEYNLRYYFELTNVARTYFYPALTISASGGYTSYLSLTGPGSWVSNLRAGLTQPVFNQGLNKARLKIAQEQQQQAALGFRTAVLTAGQEVSNALYSYQTAIEKADSRRLQLQNLEKSVEYTQELVRYGFANYTEVLNAQQSLLSAQLQRINDHLQQLQAVVYLYRALGGGWK